jgi:antitoxin component YwqK of YwqJK toxin-antitoxin module
MSTKNLNLGIMLTLLLALSMNTFMSCKKDKNEPPDIPGGDDETSTYWEDDYRRFFLFDKVKTVIERDDYNDDLGQYRKMSFDQNGNMLEDAWYQDEKLSEGLVFKHNAQNRITRCEYYESGNITEIAEFTYGGTNSHNVYIPSNIFIEDLRLQKGITSIVYKQANGDIFLSLTCTSAKGNELIFTSNENKDGLTVSFYVTAQGSYPAKIDIELPETGRQPYAEVSLGSDGIPTTLYNYNYTNRDIIVDYIVKEGFLAMTSELSTYKKTGEIDYHYEYTYNENGQLETETRNGELRSEYTYEYDAKRNWTKRTGGSNPVYREYTYWE